MYLREYEKLGAELIRLGGNIGVVSATTDNFNLSAQQMFGNESFMASVGAINGVFCLVPWELDIPF